MLPKPLLEGETTRSVIAAFFEIYNTLGFGFLESNYKGSLHHELRLRGHLVEREVPVEVSYKGLRVGTYRIDMVIDRKVVVEVKSTETLSPAATRQLYNYLYASAIDVGLLLHFGPKPKFYRQVADWRNKPGQPHRDLPPLDPSDP